MTGHEKPGQPLASPRPTGYAALLTATRRNPMTGLTEELGETMVRYAASCAAAKCLFGKAYAHTENLSEILSFSPSEEGDLFDYTQTSWLSYGGLD